MNSNFIPDYVSYFETLARQHKEVLHSESQKHFFVMDINNVLGAMADSSICYPAIILNSLSSRLVGSNLDNANEHFSGGFMVIHHSHDVDDYNSMVDALAISHRIGMDFLQRIHNDILSCKPIAEKALPSWNIFNVSSKMWGPVFDNDFGFSFEFPVIRPIDTAFKPENWNLL